MSLIYDSTTLSAADKESWQRTFLERCEGATVYTDVTDTMIIDCVKADMQTRNRRRVLAEEGSNAMSSYTSPSP